VYRPHRGLETRARGWFLTSLDVSRASGLAVLGVGMVAIMLIGIVKVSLATYVLVTTVLGVSHDVSVTAVTDYLKGLEYLFLAPLGLLTFKALIRYVIVQTELAAKNEVESEHDQEMADRNLHRLKEFIVGLIAAILTTDLVARVVLDANIARLTDIGGELSMLVITLAYIWVLSRPQATSLRETPLILAGSSAESSVDE
jgi:hypothetical protein